jgi:beta-glucosidase
VYITENGAAVEDVPDAGGYVNDSARLRYLQDHLVAAGAAVADGVDLRGYFVWSLLDNLEWNEGFSRRFGIVRCDHATQQRTIKASGRWYAAFAGECRAGRPWRATLRGLEQPAWTLNSHILTATAR